ncbi:carboxymuconolactone decarboxylase family protein [Mucilaginibacter aquaedulcis]|uniref:carboxymuconolactone decarboxylase family protein n=1 Tax=Mucilaginibacter aquaedulcis TaxID=1187081 RepID=UPI0025B57367|nr:carboxymuconolactone decarboxylase family protein [Mucilaginibacter aquaedulcis]MDN3548605.1 carboxymuconolactone decarboxylase family protein [Mucilaginibacter aquaedulcis]
MKERFNLLQVLPGAYKPFIELDKMLADTPLDKIQREMIKVRTSQINGCAYCLNMHTKDAIKYGEQPQRLYVMSAWREALNWFSEQDQVILELTEQVTNISEHGVSDELFEKAVALFGEATTAKIILAIVSMNSWNRLGIAFHKHPE